MGNSYNIKGDDGGEFGPVNREELQSWISQNRCTPNTLVEVDGSGNWVKLGTLAEFADSLGHQQPAAAPEGNSGVSTLIPYKNVPALVGYYLAIFSGLGLLCPPAGFLLSLPAFILGIIGLKKVKNNPEAKGKVHAWIGIMGGGFLTIVFIGMIIVLYVNR